MRSAHSSPGLLTFLFLYQYFPNQRNNCSRVFFLPLPLFGVRTDHGKPASKKFKNFIPLALKVMELNCLSWKVMKNAVIFGTLVTVDFKVIEYRERHAF